MNLFQGIIDIYDGNDSIDFQDAWDRGIRAVGESVNQRSTHTGPTAQRAVPTISSWFPNLWKSV